MTALRESTSKAGTGGLTMLICLVSVSVVPLERAVLTVRVTV